MEQVLICTLMTNQHDIKKNVFPGIRDLNKGKASVQPNNLVSLKWCGQLSVTRCYSPQGQSWKAELEKNILGAHIQKKPNHCRGKNNLQMSTEGHTALTAAKQSSLTAFTTSGDNYTVCSSPPVVPQESPGVCVWHCVCVCLCMCVCWGTLQADRATLKSSHTASLNEN